MKGVVYIKNRYLIIILNYQITSYKTLNKYSSNIKYFYILESRV